MKDQLFLAFDEGDLLRLDELLEQGADINAKDSDGCNIALRSAINGQIDIYDHISTKANFDKKAIDKFGNDAAILAATFGQTKMYDHLISKHDFKTNSVNNVGFDAFDMALEGDGGIAMVKHLIKKYPESLNRKNIHEYETEIIEAINESKALTMKLIDVVREKGKAATKKFQNLCEEGAHPTLAVVDLMDFAIHTDNMGIYDYLVKDHDFEVTEKHLKLAVNLDLKSETSKMTKHLLEKYPTSFSFAKLNELKTYAISKKSYEMADLISSAQIKLFDDNDVVNCISPNPQLSSTWRDLEDKTIYYSLKIPPRLYAGTELTDEEKDFFREFVRTNAVGLDVSIKELDSDLMDEVSSDESKNIIFIMANSKYKNIDGGATIKYFSKQKVNEKLILLPENILTNEETKNWGKFLILHEFFGHGVGDLKHPTQVQKNDIGPFCDDNIRTENTLMSSKSVEVENCQIEEELLGKNSRKCAEKYPTELRPADIKAINLGAQKKKKIDKSYASETPATGFETEFFQPYDYSNDFDIPSQNLQNNLIDSDKQNSEFNNAAFMLGIVCAALLLRIAKKFTNKSEDQEVSKSIKVSSSSSLKEDSRKR